MKSQLTLESGRKESAELSLSLSGDKDLCLELNKKIHDLNSSLQGLKFFVQDVEGSTRYFQAEFGKEKKERLAETLSFLTSEINFLLQLYGKVTSAGAAEGRSGP